MSTTTAPTVTAADVAPGDRLPALTVDVTARTVVMGASASRDWQPQHHDHQWAVDKVGTPSIFLNTPNQAGWIQRYLTDWSGPHGRLGRLRFKMRRSVCPGDRLRFDATVDDVTTDATGCCFVDLTIELTVDGEVATAATARLALPTRANDNPWTRRGEDWQP